MSNQNFSCFLCRESLSCFNILEENELKKIDERRTDLVFQAGELIVKQKTQLTHAICIKEGFVKIFIEGPGNKNLLLRLINKPEVLVGPGQLTDEINHFSAMALTKTHVCFIEEGLIKEILQSNNQFCSQAFRSVNYMNQFYLQKLINLSYKQMHGRVAEALLYLSENIFHAQKFDMIISRSDFAALTALSKESTIRILKELKDEKIISINRNQISILKPEVLKKIANTS